MMATRRDGEMSAFERKRLENIAANRAILTDISSTAKALIPEKRPTTKPAKRGRIQPARRTPPRPTRMSSRIAGLDADNETLKRKLAVEIEIDTERAKAQKKRIKDDLILGEIAVEGKKWGNGAEGLKGLFRGAEPGVRTYTETDVTNNVNPDVKDLRARMGSLKIYEHWLPNDIKITPQRIYAMGFHPTRQKPVVFAGDKEGNFGVFDGSQTAPDVEDEDDEVANPIISAFKIHARTITSFYFSTIEQNSVYTSSYDSSIRKMDMEKGISTQVFAPSDDEDMPFSALDATNQYPDVLYFSTLDGAVGRVDTRARNSEEIWKLSDSKIGGFSLHPRVPHLLATASLDRTMKVWDLRKILGKNDLRHPSLLGEHESRLSVSHASWSPGGQVATSSYDDTIKIYDFSNAASWEIGHDLSLKDMQPAHVVRHNNQTGRWVTILKPQWQKDPQDGMQKFAIANMNRFVDLYYSDGSQLAQLDGEGITAVPAVAHFHPTMDWVAGGNGSGKLCLWS